MPADLNDYFKKQQQQKQQKNAPEFNLNLGNKGIGAIIAMIILAAVIISKPYAIVTSGQVGIKVTTGSYDPVPLNPGFHFVLPFFQRVILVDVRTRQTVYTSSEQREMVRGSDIRYQGSINVLDARNLPVAIDITAQYSLNPDNAPQTISVWGLNSWEEKIIDSVLFDVTRSVVGKYTAEDLPTKREEIAVAIEQQVRKSVDAQENHPVSLKAIKLRSIILPPKVKEQIERVQIAKQEAERTKYEVERANQEAQKRAALARGVAEAAKIEAQGKADAVKIEADAKAYANGQLARSLTPSLLELKQIETQREFNEALKANTNAQIFLTPGGAVPNIWLDGKSPKRSTTAAQ